MKTEPVNPSGFHKTKGYILGQTGIANETPMYFNIPPNTINKIRAKFVMMKTSRTSRCEQL
jgi:hypothetical protein